MRPGDRVAAFTMLGGFAEVAVAPTFMTFPLPDRLDLAQGAALVLNYHTAWFSLVTRGRLAGARRSSSTAPPAGSAPPRSRSPAAWAPARSRSSPATRRSASPREAGADEVVRSDGPWKDAAKELSGGGVDVVLDPVGGDRFTDSLRALREGGRLVVVGFTGGSIPEVRVNRLLLNNTEVVGAGWGAYVMAKPAVSQEIGAALGRLVDEGFVTPDRRRALRARGRRRRARAHRRPRRDRQGRPRVALSAARAVRRCLTASWPSGPGA